MAAGLKQTKMDSSSTSMDLDDDLGEIQEYYCHGCHKRVHIEGSQPVCPFCHSEFVEAVEDDSDISSIIEAEEAEALSGV